MAHGCGCAPDGVIQWLVVGLLAFAAAVVFALGWWRQRRSTRPKTPSGPRTRVERSATTVAGLVILGLAWFVALVPMGSDPALLVLALGATIGSGGAALGSPRTRRAVTTPAP